MKLDGISLEKKDGMEPPLLHISGVDLVDGTPIYDVKPYLPYAESIPNAESGYAGDPVPRLEVNVEEAVVEAFAALDERSRRVITESLSLDPRPSATGDPNRAFGALLCGRNVRFRIIGATCWISAVEVVD